ncbi:hypothetical protein [Desulfamplus magnetovallimortis]|nr:hypothetical protein [Desulfamplus magnetovallimortis]
MSEPVVEPFTSIGQSIKQARDSCANVILMIGAHVIRSGVQRFIIDLMEKGMITCLAVNGAGLIHDFELALIGATTESVRKYLQNGQFGLWKETGIINDIIIDAAKNGCGAATAVGKYIEKQKLQGRNLSLLAAAKRLGILCTCHVSIGQDIVHEHPNCDGASWGASSYTDFLHFAAHLDNLQSGVIMNLGSAVMGPEVFLKALAMARNIAKQQEKQINQFTTLVTDLAPLPDEIMIEPPKTEHLYYFRPWKTLLSRSISSGSKSYYARMHHSKSVPQIWMATVEAEQNTE